MGDPFRGDVEAAHARIETLEADNLRLRAGLDAGAERTARRARRVGVAGIAVAVLVSAVVLPAYFDARQKVEALRGEIAVQRAEYTALAQAVAAERRPTQPGRPPDVYETNPYAEISAANTIRSAFAQILERAPTDAELASWIAKAPRDGALVRSTLAHEDEASERIHGLYQTYLNRRAEPEGHAHWTRYLEVAGLAAVRRGIASSPEAAGKRDVQKPSCDPPWTPDRSHRKAECPAK